VMAARAVGLPTGVPPLAPERPVKWPKRTRARLSNGLEVILAEARSIPKFHGELFFRSGNAAVVHRAPGLAEMTATVARTATTKRASRQLEEDLRRIGADLSSSAGADISAIGFSGLAEFAEPLLELVNELAREAAFPVAEFERERRQKLEEVKMQRTEPGFLANERLRKVLFGAHPYAQVSPSEAQVAAYQREDLSAVYREFYTPENGALLLVGDFDANEMLPAAEKVFGKWSGKRPETPAAPAPANPRGRRVCLVHVPGAVQTQILAARDAEWFADTTLRYGGERIAGRLSRNLSPESPRAYAARSAGDGAQISGLRQHANHRRGRPRANRIASRALRRTRSLRRAGNAA